MRAYGVKIRNCNDDRYGSQSIGTSNENPIFGTHIDELEFPDARIKEYSINVIVENLLTMANDDGWDAGLLNDIVDFCKDDSISH